MAAFKIEDSQPEVAEPSAFDQFAEMVEALDHIFLNGRMKLESKFDTSASVMRKYLKVAAHRVREDLEQGTAPETMEWYNMMLVLSERISYVEKSENLLPMAMAEVKAKFTTPKELEKLGHGADLYWKIKKKQRSWNDKEQMYLATISLLQREVEKPRYHFDIEAECMDLYWERKQDLEEILALLQYWQHEGYSVCSYSTLYYRTINELEQLNPSRLVDRVMGRQPVPKGELPTNPGWEKLPRTKWIRRPHPDQTIVLDICGSKHRSPFVHARDPNVVNLHKDWEAERLKHEKTIVVLARKVSILEARNKLDYRIAYRVQKRSTELREQAATLKVWLAEGFLNPTYGSRFIEIQNELSVLTVENLLQEVQERGKGQTSSVNRSVKFKRIDSDSSDSDPGVGSQEK